MQLSSEGIALRGVRVGNDDLRRSEHFGAKEPTQECTAHRAGANDAIFIGDDGFVNEATAANVFVIFRGQLLTPPEGPKILSGITRAKLFEAARTAGVAAAERRVTKKELLTADEAFLSSTTAEVVPILTVDGQKIGTGKPGPIAARIYAQFVKTFTS